MNDHLAIEHELRPVFPKGEVLLWQGIPSQRYFFGFLQGVALLFLATWLVLFAFKLPAFRESDLSVISLFSSGLLRFWLLSRSCLAPPSNEGVANMRSAHTALLFAFTGLSWGLEFTVGASQAVLRSILCAQRP